MEDYNGDMFSALCAYIEVLICYSDLASETPCDSNVEFRALFVCDLESNTVCSVDELP